MEDLGCLVGTLGARGFSSSQEERQVRKRDAGRRCGSLSRFHHLQFARRKKEKNPSGTQDSWSADNFENLNLKFA